MKLLKRLNCFGRKSRQDTQSPRHSDGDRSTPKRAGTSKKDGRSKSVKRNAAAATGGGSKPSETTPIARVGVIHDHTYNATLRDSNDHVCTAGGDHTRGHMNLAYVHDALTSGPVGGRSSKVNYSAVRLTPSKPREMPVHERGAEISMASSVASPYKGVDCTLLYIPDTPGCNSRIKNILESVHTCVQTLNE